MKTNQADMRARESLPEHLKILSLKYPRATWPAKDDMGGLTQFWLDRHLMFRRLLGQLQEEMQGFASDAGQAGSFAQRMPRLAGFLIQNLHGHHQVEDHHYFPMLSGHDERLKPGFEMLDLDHQALDAALHDYQSSAEALLQALARDASQRPAQLARYESQLTNLATWVERHLFDEEELIVPILLHYGEPQL